LFVQGQKGIVLQLQPSRSADALLPFMLANRDNY